MNSAHEERLVARIDELEQENARLTELLNKIILWFQSTTRSQKKLLEEIETTARELS